MEFYYYQYHCNKSFVSCLIILNFCTHFGKKSISPVKPLKQTNIQLYLLVHPANGALAEDLHKLLLGDVLYQQNISLCLINWSSVSVNTDQVCTFCFYDKFLKILGQHITIRRWFSGFGISKYVLVCSLLSEFPKGSKLQN